MREDDARRKSVSGLADPDATNASQNEGANRKDDISHVNSTEDAPSKNTSDHNSLEEINGQTMDKEAKDCRKKSILRKSDAHTVDKKQLVPDDEIQDSSDIEITVKVIREDEDGLTDGQQTDGEETVVEEPEMSHDDMKVMYNAVTAGDIDLLDDLLDIPGADIKMEWFSENLLLASLRAGHTMMALFLIDNGVDYNYEITHVDKSDTGVDWYTTNCRQMAYENELLDVVDVIDEKYGQLWPNYTSISRIIRYKKPLEEKQREREEQETLENRREQGEEDVISQDGNDINKSNGNKGEGLLSRQCDTGILLDSKKSGSQSDGALRRDDFSSGYSTLSSSESQPNLASTSHVGGRKREQIRFRKTKSALARLTTSRLHMTEYLQSDVIPIRPTSSGVGSYRMESKLWSANAPAINAWTGDTKKHRTNQNTVTYSPWKTRRQSTNPDLFSNSEIVLSKPNLTKRMVGSSQQKFRTIGPYDRLAGSHDSFGSHDSLMGCLAIRGSHESSSRIRPDTTAGRIYLSNTNPRIKERPGPNVHVYEHCIDTSDTTRSFPSTADRRPCRRDVNLTSVLRHRGPKIAIGERIGHVLPVRRYSPAGHLRIASSKGAT